MRRQRPLLGLLAVAATAMELSGCVVFSGPPLLRQPEVIGSVEVQSVLCRSGVTANLFCETPPAPAGSVWVGYISETFTYAPATTSTAGLFFPVARFALPQAADGGPFQGPLRVRPVIGARAVTAGLPATRPVDCGTSLTTPQGSGETICVDSPAPGQLATDIVLATRDLAIRAGAPTGATAGPATTASEAGPATTCSWAGPAGTSCGPCPDATSPGEGRASTAARRDGLWAAEPGHPPLAPAVLAQPTTWKCSNRAARWVRSGR